MLRIVVLFLLFTCSFAYSGTVENAFKALNRKDYFTANQLFRKSLNKNTSVSAFGLTQLYLKHDYLCIDSAYKYILLAENTFQYVSTKKRIKFQFLQFDSLAIQSWKQVVSDAYFEIELINLSEENLQKFIDRNSWSRHLSKAIFFRDSIAFSFVLKQHNTVSSEAFMKKYPKSVFFDQAKNLFLDEQYKEITISGDISDYLSFLNTCPENPHVPDAENRIYEISVKNGNINDYISFIKTYTQNRNINEAWKKLYQLYMKDFDLKRFESFEREFPDFPFKHELESDQKLFSENYFPFVFEEKYGYMNSQGQCVIDPEYDEAGPFQEGLAVVSKGLKYGIINKKNEKVVDFIYDEILEFTNGRAIVLYNDLYNLIDRSGRVISNEVFKDISIFNSKYFFGVKDSSYEFFDFNLKEISKGKYNEIGMLVDGFSIVQKDNRFGLIDSALNEVIPVQFDALERFNEKLFTYTINGKKGIIKSDGVKIIEPLYDDISKFNPENNSAVVKIGNTVFWIKTDGSKLMESKFDYFSNVMDLAQFSNGFAIFKKKGKFGLIDEKGKIALKPTADIIGKYVGLIPMMKLNKWGLIDFKSKVILPYEYELIESWSNYGILVQKNGLIGLMDDKLEFILPISFNSINVFEDKYFIVTKGSKCGLYDFSGKEVLPIVYDRIKLFEKDCLTLYNTNEFEYYFTRTNIHLKRVK